MRQAVLARWRLDSSSTFRLSSVSASGRYGEHTKIFFGDAESPLDVAALGEAELLCDRSWVVSGSRDAFVPGGFSSRGFLMSLCAAKCSLFMAFALLVFLEEVVPSLSTPFEAKLQTLLKKLFSIFLLPES